MNDFKIEIDSELESLIPTYLENQQKNLKKMLESLHAGDFETVQALGHNLKGSGGGYGFDQLSEIGAAIEQGAKDKDSKLIQSKLGELEDYLFHVEVVYV